MAIKCKMFEVAYSKNTKGMHNISIIKEVFKRESHCIEHLEANIQREESSRQQRQQGLNAFQAPAVTADGFSQRMDSSTSH